jgi:hypothetical protein
VAQSALAAQMVRIAPRAHERLKAFQNEIASRGLDSLPTGLDRPSNATLSETLEVVLQLARLAWPEAKTVKGKKK